MKTESELHSPTSPVAEPAESIPRLDHPLSPAEPVQPIEPSAVIGAVLPHGDVRPIPFSRRARVAVLAAGGLLCFLFLLRIASILHPFLWAIVVAYAFNPLITAVCARMKLPRLLVVGPVYLVGLGALAALLAVAVPRLNAEVTQLITNLPTITSDLQTRYFGSTSQPLLIAGFNVDVPQVTRTVANSLNTALGNFAGGTFSAVVGTVERVTQFLLFLIVTFYLLLDAPKFGPYFTHLIPARHRDEVLEVTARMDSVLSQYVRAQLVLITLMATLGFIVLSVMGVRFAFVLAPLVGVLEIFPIIGPFAAITVVTIVALFSPPNYGLTSSSSALIVALAFFILRQIEDYAVIPNVIGHAVRLHPAFILFAVAVGASVGGGLGLFLAVPISGALKVLCGYLYQKLVPE